MGATDVTLSNAGIWNGQIGESWKAGEVIDTNQAVYLNTTDNRIYKAVGNDPNKKQIRGFAGSKANAIGADIIVNVAPGGQITGLSGLTPGAPYFLSDTTAGAVMRVADVGAADWSSFAGHAVSATIFQIAPVAAPAVHA